MAAGVQRAARRRRPDKSGGQTDGKNNKTRKVSITHASSELEMLCCPSAVVRRSSILNLLIHELPLKQINITRNRNSYECTRTEIVGFMNEYCIIQKFFMLFL